MPPTTRRRLLATAVLPWLAGCGSPLPLRPAPPGQAEARTRLLDSARAHGWDAYRALADINVAYGGRWRPWIDRLQPEVVDAGYRGHSEERLLPAAGVVAQSYQGPRGRKQVFWRRGDGSAARPGEVGLWFDGRPSTDARLRSAAALVAEGYGLFLLGPLWLAGRDLPMRLAGRERVDGRACDVVEAWLSPGLGQVAQDRVALCIDRDDAVTRRVRFTLEGFESTRGAVAQVDSFEHRRLFGVLWPMRQYEEVVHPLRLPAHDWMVTGLDVNRGYGPEALAGPTFGAAAAAPAAALAA
jgi:hypothetical protein